MKSVLSIAVLAAALGATSSAYAGEKQDKAPPPADGEGALCVSIPRIQRTDILNDRQILFYMKGKDIYLNELPHNCPQLGFEESFTYATSLTQLCNTDIITVLLRTGGGDIGGLQRGASCGLGKFVPITQEEAKKLKDEAKMSTSKDKDAG
ncbi:MAG: DUF6491 family protein [Pseudomonadota bacterium]